MMWYDTISWVSHETLVGFALKTPMDEEDVAILVEHAVLKEKRVFAKMKDELNQFKKFTRTKSTKREPIPKDVQMFVWQREEGCCACWVTDPKRQTFG